MTNKGVKNVQIRIKSFKLWIVVVVMVCSLFLSILLYQLLHPTRVQSFDLQIGHQHRDDLPGMLDQGLTFTNNQQLFVIAIYPDEPYVQLNQKAKLTVIRKSDSKVMQIKEEKESGDLAAWEISLHNTQWESGVYKVVFTRNSDVIEQKEITLK